METNKSSCRKERLEKVWKKNITQSLLKFSFHQTIENKKTNVHLKAREKKVILLIITDGETWHYLAVKNLVLLRGIALRHYSDYYCTNGLHSFRAK